MRIPVLATLLAAASLVFVGGPARAQAPPDRLRVYLDCRSGCDFDFIRTEVTFVDYVRDRADADVHVLITSQTTGAGGSENTVEFIGRGPFEAGTDTLTYRTSATDTPDLRRKALARVLRVGLFPFATATGAAEHLDVTFEPPAAADDGASAPARDPWNAWVFRVRGNGFLNGESQQQFSDFSGGLSANRVTEGWKIQTGISGSYSESHFEVSDTQTIRTIRRSYSADILVVRSIGPHLSAGMEATIASSTFGNQERLLRVAPAVEYNFVPYAESTRRIFTLLYTAGVNSYDYREMTIFGEVAETRPAHSLSAGYTTRQPWGQFSATVAGSQFLHDTHKHRLTFSGNTSVQIIRGLSFNVGGTYQRIRDQLALSAEGATRDEILLRQKQIATDYNFFMHFGLSYQFGSAINNIVNPRFRSGAGGEEFIVF